MVQETTNGGARCYHLRRPNSTSTELVYTGEIVPGWNDDFMTSRLCGTKPWKKPLSENRRNRRPTECILSSAIVECGTSSRGAAACKGWSLLKASKRVQFLRDLGKECPGRYYACKNSPRRMEKWLLRLRVTGCLQRPHARGNCVYSIITFHHANTRGSRIARLCLLKVIVIHVSCFAFLCLLPLLSFR